MKPIGEQFQEAFAWKNRLYSLRDFILTTIAGFAILYGFISWTSGNSVHSGFDIKIAIGCFALVGVCVLLASNRVSVLSCAVMIPAALVWFNALLTGNHKVIVFCVADFAFGFLILVAGTLARSRWQSRSSVHRND
jgi:hypothetical protein